MGSLKQIKNTVLREHAAFQLLGEQTGFVGGKILLPCGACVVGFQRIQKLAQPFGAVSVAQQMLRFLHDGFVVQDALHADKLRLDLLRRLRGTSTVALQLAVILVQILRHQQMEFHGENVIVDLKDLRLLGFRQLSADKVLPNNGLQLLLLCLQICRDMLFDGTRHVTEIRLARVVQQAAVNDRQRMTACGGLLCAGKAVLRNGIKVPKMPVSPADQRQRMTVVM